MLQTNVEAIGEMRILTQGYQAEFGRSSGMQITAVTKSGTNQIRGSFYDLERNSDWNSNTWAHEERRSEAVSKQRDCGYTLGGRSASPAATTSCSSSTPRVPSADDGRRHQPVPRADGARAARRLFADTRQQRRALQSDSRRAEQSAVHGGEHGRLFPRRRRAWTDSAEPAVFSRA